MYVPLRDADPAATQTVVQLHVLDDGTPVVPVFTDRARLAAACGDLQPWMLIPVERLVELRPQLGFELLLVDATPEEVAAGG